MINWRFTNDKGAYKRMVKLAYGGKQEQNRKIGFLIDTNKFAYLQRPTDLARLYAS